MSLDFKTLSVDPDNQKADMTLLHPGTGEPLTDEQGNNATLTLYGPDSSVLKTFHRKRLNQQSKKGFKKGSYSFSAEEVDQIRVDRCVAAIASWQNIGFEGKELECTPENKEMLLESAPWMIEQVYDFIDDRANFMKG